jgi:hypothetical protein
MKKEFKKKALKMEMLVKAAKIEAEVESID